MADITVSYKGNTIAEVSASGTTTLGTSGKYCEDDISIAYTKPSGSYIGGTVAWNQIAELGNGERNNAYLSYNATTKETTVTPTNYNNNAVGAYNLVLSANAVVGHKYFESISVNLDHSGSIRFGFSVGMKTFDNISSGHYVNLSNIQNLTSASSLSVYLSASSSGWTDGTYKFKDVQCIDLTQMFGSTIADYVYTLESGTAGAGIAWLKANGFFSKPYYPYAAASLQSVELFIPPITDSNGKIIGYFPQNFNFELRGILKLDANNVLYYDGDEYDGNGTVMRKCGVRAYESGDATDGSTMITDGTNTVYKLATPTTESV